MHNFVRVCAVLIGSIGVLSGCSAQDDGNPLVSDHDENLRTQGRAIALLDFEEVGGNCSAFFVANGNAREAPVYAITSARCITPRRFNAGDQGLLAGIGNVQFHANRLHDAEDERPDFRLSAVAYGSLRGTDVAIVEVDTTRDELDAAGITAIPIADSTPSDGSAISVMGIPFDWPRFVRHGECAVRGKASSVIEDDLRLFDAIETDCSGLRYALGSPLLDQTGAVFAITAVSTLSIDPPACSFGAPCEVESGSLAVEADRTYAVDITSLRACFGADGRFESSLCELDQYQGTRVASLTRTPIMPFCSGTEPCVLADPPYRFDLSLIGSSATHAMFKVGRAETMDCRSRDGYGAVTSLEEATAAINSYEIAAEDAVHVACLVTGSTAQYDEASWQSFGHPTALTLQYDQRFVAWAHMFD